MSNTCFQVLWQRTSFLRLNYPHIGSCATCMLYENVWYEVMCGRCSGYFGVAAAAASDVATSWRT
eukprot:6855316-Pyramimonas_sp.AAC.2